MSLILYYSPISPPARAVLLTIRSLGLNVEIKNVNLLKGEHRSAEFLKVNPFHQIPVLVERKSSMSSPTLISDLVLSESRAIMSYLVNSRRADSSLYPIDPVRRAVVDQRLYFDATVVFPRNCLATVSSQISFFSLSLKPLSPSDTTFGKERDFDIERCKRYDNRVHEDT